MRIFKLYSAITPSELYQLFPSVESLEKSHMKTIIIIEGFIPMGAKSQQEHFFILLEALIKLTNIDFSSSESIGGYGVKGKL